MHKTNSNYYGKNSKPNIASYHQTSNSVLHKKFKEGCAVFQVNCLKFVRSDTSSVQKIAERAEAFFIVSNSVKALLYKLSYFN